MRTFCQNILSLLNTNTVHSDKHVTFVEFFKFAKSVGHVQRMFPPLSKLQELNKCDMFVTMNQRLTNSEYSNRIFSQTGFLDIFIEIDVSPVIRKHLIKIHFIRYFMFESFNATFDHRLAQTCSYEYFLLFSEQLHRSKQQYTKKE